MRNGEQARDEMVKKGQILQNAVEVRRRWAKYFEQVLNVKNVREVNYKCNWWMLVLGELNERAISIGEVKEAVNELKSGMAAGEDGFPIASETIERKFCYGGSTYGLVWCMHSAPKEG